MKKIFIFLIVSVQTFLFAEGGTELEELWRLAAMCNLDVKVALSNKKSAEDALLYFWQERIPSVSFSASSSFLQKEDSNMEAPQSILSSIMLKENLPGGLSLIIEPNVNLSKGRDEASELVYSDSESIDISIRQSLKPYWLQGRKVDPEWESLYLDWEAYQADLDNTIFSCIKNVTDYYIQLRQCIFRIKSIEATLDLYKELLQAWEELKSRGKASFADFYSVKEDLYSYEEELYEYKNRKEMLCIQLNQLLGGEKFFYGGNKVISVVEELPDFEKRLFEENPKLLYLSALKEKKKLDYIMIRQDTSPVLSFGGSIPLFKNERDYYSKILNPVTAKTWSINVGLDFSPLLSNNQDYLRKIYERDFEEIENRILYEKSVLRNEYTYYEELIASTKRRLENLNEVCRNKRELLEASKLLYERGECSKIELLNARIDFQISENDYSIQQDMFWFYNWMKNNCEE
ncbi:MAG: TolC family protein [Treponema sp.]|nr:TolC family protein [Treponema sp.]